MASNAVANPEMFAPLREKLPKGRVLLPGDNGYDDSLKRWSATCVKPAVSFPSFFRPFKEPSSTD
jgi:hypothetical protein